MCSNVGAILLIILVATFLIIWSASQAKGKLGKVIGWIILIFGAFAFVYQAYLSISIGCKTGTCPMMNMMGNQNHNMPMMQQRMGKQQRMPMGQMPMQDQQTPPAQQNNGQ
jgi:enhancing lycopene biosynthesis protein 2